MITAAQKNFKIRCVRFDFVEGDKEEEGGRGRCKGRSMVGDDDGDKGTWRCRKRIVTARGFGSND